MNYKEHISDTAWLKLIEDGKDPAKELALRQKRKALEIEQRKANGEQVDSNSEDSLENSEEPP